MIADNPLESLESKVRYWNSEGENLALSLYRYLKELSTKIPASSKTSSVELKFFDRKVTGNDYMVMRLALVFLEYHPVRKEIAKKPLLEWVYKDFRSSIFKLEEKMNRTKFCSFHYSIEELGDRKLLSLIPVRWIPSPREWEGNFKRRLMKVINYYYRLVGPSRRKPKRQERVRGYRDHGGASSVSERARRQANTSSWNEYLTETLDIIRETGCSIQVALRINKMEQRE
jgi:hypothetical protein